MKITLLSVMLLLAVLRVHAQKEIPEFGKIDKSDLVMKECDFDKDAEAYRLLDYGNVRYERGKNLFRTRMEIRERIKILKEKGIDRANIKIGFYSKNNFETINDIAAVTYNLDDAGNVITTKLDKASIFTKKIDKRHSEVVFTMPQVKVGCVIEYKYSTITENPEHLPDWYFQGAIPTRLSQYQIRVPSMLRFVNQVLAYQIVEQKDDMIDERMATNNGIYEYKSIIKTYTLHNIPALTEEVYMGSAKDYLERVQFQLSQIDWGDGSPIDIRSTWPKLTQELLDDEDFGLQLKKNIPHTQELDKQLKDINDDYKKMIVIHDYVRRNMNSNYIENIYTTDGIKSAWDKKTGSTTEINLILLNLLRDAGLQAYPLLISTRDNGSVNTLYPFLSQFNNVMAYVTIADKNYVLNAADKYNPGRLTPYDVMNTEAFVVDNTKGGWIMLNNNKQSYKNVVTIFAEVTNDGFMEGEATINSYDYSKNPRIKKWKEEKPKFQEYFTKNYVNMKIENVEVNNADNDTLPLEQKVKFKSQLNSSGDYKYFTINLFNGLEKNPFIADKRITDIDFGYNQSYAIYGSISLPDGYKVEGLPKNIIMITPDTSIVLKRLMQLDDNTLNLRVTLDFKKPVYPASEYDDFKEFYKKLYAALNEQIVIKKKGATP